MAKKTPTEVLLRKEKVKAAVDLRDDPEGTTGKVLLSNGLEWIRNWVRFDNGVEMGSIHRDKLVRVGELQHHMIDIVLRPFLPIQLTMENQKWNKKNHPTHRVITLQN